MLIAQIRFVDEPGEACHYLKLGPMDNPTPPEREFQGGEVVSVQMRPTDGKPDCVDMMFDDGEFAIEVPRDFFVVVCEKEEE